MDEILAKILENGVTGGALFGCCWWLVRSLKEQYDKRIDALEAVAKECSEDRRALHIRMEEILMKMAKPATPPRLPRKS